MNAFWAVQTGSSVILNHFAKWVVVHLDLPVGSWVVLGKGLIVNHDSSNQSATVAIEMAGNPPTFLDKLDLWMLDEQGGEAFYLQCALDLNETSRTVRLVANTYKGAIAECSLIAIPVDRVVRSNPAPYQA